MGRGLGKLQQAILDYLQSEGKPCWVMDITFNVYTPETWPAAGERVEVPYSFYTSVRRAINALEGRGLVRCGLPAEKSYRGEERMQRMCWLAGQPGPLCRPLLSGERTEQAVIDALRAALAETNPVKREDIFEEWWSSRMQPPEKGCVKYAWLVGAVEQRLQAQDMVDRRRIRSAVTRAVDRLIAYDVLTGYKRPNGWYGWIKLNLP